MSNEIKQGDKVRVSRDIPQFYLEYNSYRMFEIEHRVVDVNMEDGFALLDSIPPKFTTILPTKYLVKVEAEAKEAKFKVGDVVRIKPTADKLHQGYQNGYAWLPERDEYLGRVASVKEIWCDGSIILSIRNNMLWEPIDLEPYTEPTEQTEAEKKPYDGISEETANEISNMLEAYAKALSGIADSFDWQRYEADLAKELAIVYGKRGKSPLDAVAAAKEITKRLKQK